MHRLLTGLWLISLLVMAVVLLHEYYVLIAEPVKYPHTLIHGALMVVTVLLVLSVWLLCLAYRRMQAYQAALVDAYVNIEDLVRERTSALQEVQTLLESLFDAFRERALVVDPDNRIVRANRKAIDGAQEVIQDHFFDEIYPDCAEQDERRSELRLIQYTFRNGKPQRNRLIRGGQDCSRVFSVDTYPVCSSEGEVRLVIEVVRDITDFKYLEIQHQHHDKMAALGLLAAGMAHNMGNPLASLSSELQLLKGETDIEIIRASLEVLDKHVRRMAASIHDILGFARKRGSTMQRVAIADAVHDTLRLLRHDPRAKNVRFESTFDADVPEIQFNEDDLILILTNVLVNALEALPDGGTIRFSCSRDGSGDVLLNIADNGEGMDPKTLEQAPRPLFTTRSDGTGLGLALVTNIVCASNGSISIESSPAGGTSVTLRLLAAN